MIHDMHLNQEPFDLVKSGKKIIEIRLFDEKRRKINLGDTIVFEKLPDGEKVKCEVIGLSIFKSFKDLLLAFDRAKFGHPNNITLEEQINRQYAHYSKGEEEANGVVGIHIKLI